MKLSVGLKAVLAILGDGEVHSISELANHLQVSHLTIKRHLEACQELEIIVNSIPGKGYQLECPMEWLDRESILSLLTLPARRLLTNLEIFEQISSTNSYLMNQDQNSAPSGQVCLAERQTAGKGRVGRTWISPFGHNIYLSILWYFHNNVNKIMGLSLAIGVIVVRVLRKFLNKEIQLKWPNDIYWEGRKLGGILVEVSGQNEGAYRTVTGLGLNTYISSLVGKEITQAWADLAEVSQNNKINRNQLIAELLNGLLPLLSEFEERGVESYIAEYRAYDCLIGKPANLYLGSNRYYGMVKDITDQGYLLWLHEDGRFQTFASGEVSFSSA